MKLCTRYRQTTKESHSWVGGNANKSFPEFLLRIVPSYAVRWIFGVVSVGMICCHIKECRVTAYICVILAPSSTGPRKRKVKDIYSILILFSKANRDTEQR
jgi:hypothetical protein